MSPAATARAAGSRFAVGIDLGTTNCALSALPLAPGPHRAGEPLPPPQHFDVPQLVAPGQVEPRPLLPSFLYRPHAAEFPAGSLQLPWSAGAEELVVGELARNQGALTPVRLVSSAKSWLSHSALDRRADLLPLGSPPDVPKISPLQASARYLAHLRQAWDAAHDRDQALENQELTLTVPASFDAVARELTVEAAALAGLRRLTLLEEPQAALYAWVEAMGDSWRRQVRVGELILVCDIGGGTTDFSLIAAVDHDGELALQRVAVGDHILLGGDNMDLTLAFLLEQKLAAAGKKLDSWQLLALTHSARLAKEQLFADGSLAVAPVTVPGRSSRLVGGTIRTELTRAELELTLTDGFFPRVDVAERPNVPRRTGLTQLGLPYAADPAVTRHLAAFLSRHRQGIETAADDGRGPRLAGRDFLHPSAVLFNGGVMKAGQLKARVLEVLQTWVAAEGGQPPVELPGAELDLAVAHGGACFGRVRQGRGIRIRGGTARAYYVGIETAAPAVPGMAPPLKALCLAPMGMEEGTTVELPAEELGVVVGEPAQFRFFASSLRHEDPVGQVVEPWEQELDELPPVEATLPAEGLAPGQVVPVRLQAHVTAIGTLELHCVERSGRAWKLEFNLRNAEADEAGAEARPPAGRSSPD